MKKSLLLILIVGTYLASEGQNSSSVNQKFASASPVQLAQNRLKAQQVSEKRSVSNPSTNRVARVASTSLPFLGSSANVNGVLDATTTAVTANQACDLIVMTHRDNNSKVAICGSGAYIAAYSTDNGADWDTTVTLFCNSDANAGARYPNGVLFNPAGNTNPLNVYDAEAGPFTNGLTTGDGWTQTVYGSVTLGNTNAYGFNWANGAPGVVTQNTGDLSFMTSCDDSTVHVIGEDFKTNSAGDFLVWEGVVITSGKFNPVADSFTWTQTVLRPHIVPNFRGFTTSSPYDSFAAPVSVPGMAWSQDGKTGYVVILANLDSVGYNYTSDQPIVYKTTNSGKLWTMMPPFNFRNIPSLTQYLVPSHDSGEKTPLWYAFETPGSNSQGATNSWDLTVDYNGNLHIFSAIISNYYTNPDSGFGLEWYVTKATGTALGYIYDVSTMTGGGWQARFIDSMVAAPSHNVHLYNSDWDSISGTWVGFGNRLQASRTTDGKHVFCTWEDDLSGNANGLIGYPDIKGEAYSVPTGLAGRVKRFTTTENNYFLCASDIALLSGGTDSTYTIPCTIAYSQTTPNSGINPINYYYLGTIIYNDTLGSTTSLQKISDQGFSIGHNYPNPFNKTTQFNINLTKESVVSVDVFNLVGEKVYSIPSQQMTPGSHIMSIDGSSLASGIYFYRVIANGSAATDKMVVQ